MAKYSRTTTWLNRQGLREAGDLTLAIRKAGCVILPLKTKSWRSLECVLPSGKRVRFSSGSYDELDRLHAIAKELGVTVDAH